MRTLFLCALVACGGATPAPKTTDNSQAEPTGVDALIVGGSAGSKKAERRTNDKWSACHAGFKPTGDAASDVVKLAQGCAAITRMHPVGEIMKGTQKASDPAQSFKLHVEANKCYRVYGESSKGITDLDAVIKDSTGAIAGEDSTDDPDPVVLEDGAVCFSEADDATVVVGIGGGEGSYALQAWSN